MGRKLAIFPSASPRLQVCTGAVDEFMSSGEANELPSSGIHASRELLILHLLFFRRRLPILSAPPTLHTTCILHRRARSPQRHGHMLHSLCRCLNLFQLFCRLLLSRSRNLTVAQVHVTRVCVCGGPWMGPWGTREALWTSGTSLTHFMGVRIWIHERHLRQAERPGRRMASPDGRGSRTRHGAPATSISAVFSASRRPAQPVFVIRSPFPWRQLGPHPCDTRLLVGGASLFGPMPSTPAVSRFSPLLRQMSSVGPSVFCLQTRLISGSAPSFFHLYPPPLAQEMRRDRHVLAVVAFAPLKQIFASIQVLLSSRRSDWLVWRGGASLSNLAAVDSVGPVQRIHASITVATVQTRLVGRIPPSTQHEASNLQMLDANDSCQ